MTQDTNSQTDAYYGDDEADDEVDLSFLNKTEDEEDQADTTNPAKKDEQ